MIGVIFALITVLAWGSWLAPSQNVPMKGQQTRNFFVTLAVFVMSIIVAAFWKFEGLTLRNSIAPFIGGLIWAIGGYCAFSAVSKIGMAKAFGIWAPLNIVSSIIWGIILFGEFIHTGLSNILYGLACVVAIIIGLLFIIFSGGSSEKTNEKNEVFVQGVLLAIATGILLGSYFIPIRIAETTVPMWVATFPLAVGMFLGASILVGLTKSSIQLEKSMHYLLVLSTGALWGIGNYGALRMMELIGTGRGYTIANMCVVVNALIGIYIFKNPPPKSKAALLTFGGIVIATAGAVILASLKS